MAQIRITFFGQFLNQGNRQFRTDWVIDTAAQLLICRSWQQSDLGQTQPLHKYVQCTMYLHTRSQHVYLSKYMWSTYIFGFKVFRITSFCIHTCLTSSELPACPKFAEQIKILTIKIRLFYNIFILTFLFEDKWECIVNSNWKRIAFPQEWKQNSGGLIYFPPG